MNNPLIKLEMLRRFRSPAAAWGIPIVMLLPGLAVIAVYATSTAFAQMTAGAALMNWGGGVDSLQRVGQAMFAWVIGLLGLTMLMLVPSMVGTSIAGERHAQTLQPLQLTAITPGQIVIGKLVSSLAYLLLLLVCTTPIMAIPFLLGGVPVSWLIGSLIVLFLIMLELAAVSLAVSATFSSPAVASIVSVVSCGVLIIAPFVVTTVLGAVMSMSDSQFDIMKSPLHYLMGLSPISLGTWVVALEDDAPNELISIGARWVPVLCFMVVTASSLLWARRKVTAPVDKDR